MLIAIEGIDGVGKSTVIPVVAEILRKRGVSVSVKPEFPPGTLSTQFQEALGHGLFLAQHLEMPPAAAFFYLLHAEVMATSELQGQTVEVILADRYLHTHALYQAYFAIDPEQFDPARILCLLAELFSILELPVPDFVIVLDAPIDVLLDRLTHREAREIEASERAILTTFRTIYLSLATSSVFPSIVVDATKERIELAQTIADAIFEYLSSTPNIAK